MIHRMISRDLTTPPHILFRSEAGTDVSTSPLRLDRLPWYTSGFE